MHIYECVTRASDSLISGVYVYLFGLLAALRRYALES